MYARPISRRGWLACVAAVAPCAGQTTTAPPVNEHIRVGDSEIEVSIGGAALDLATSDVLAWVHECATAVSRYFGRFPVDKARLTIAAREGRPGVANGRTWGGPDPHTRIVIGQHSTLAALRHDWVLTHEFVHYGFPDMPDRHHWIEEGLATYIEPIARVAVGTQTAATAWFEMVRDMPQGLPKNGDEGLDNTHTWGRTYWGGAIFCLLADIAIRKCTGDAKGLQDALRAILAAGGNIEAHWPIERALQIGDRAVADKGAQPAPLMTLYDQMAAKPSPVDLDALWKELGVERQGDTAIFNDHAPLAQIRRAILT